MEIASVNKEYGFGWGIGAVEASGGFLGDNPFNAGILPLSLYFAETFGSKVTVDKYNRDKLHEYTSHDGAYYAVANVSFFNILGVPLGYTNDTLGGSDAWTFTGRFGIGVEKSIHFPALMMGVEAGFYWRLQPGEGEVDGTFYIMISVQLLGMWIV